MTLEKFLKQRERQVVDTDLTAGWLTLSVISPMVFSSKMQFVYTTPMTFSRHNRKSNIFVLAARGAVGKNQDLEGLDYGELVAWLKEEGKDLPAALNGATMAKLSHLYKRCKKRNTTTQ